MYTTVRTAERSRTCCCALVICVTLAAFLAACSGSTGAQGPAGAAGATGATGPAGPTTTGLAITSATSITGTITSVTIAGPPVVKFELVDENGAPLTGLPAADIGFVIAKLTPGTNGMSSYWTSYIYQTVIAERLPDGRDLVRYGRNDPADHRERDERHAGGQWQRHLRVHVRTRTSRPTRS